MNVPSPHDDDTVPNIRTKRKLRPLVITMGGERQDQILQMFTTDPQLSQAFETPQFSQGVSSRSLRNRSMFYAHANDAGLLPKAEWEALRQASQEWLDEQERHRKQLLLRDMANEEQQQRDVEDRKKVKECSEGKDSGGHQPAATASSSSTEANNKQQQQQQLQQQQQSQAFVKINPSEAYFECLNAVPVEIGGYEYECVRRQDASQAQAQAPPSYPRRGSAEDRKLHYSIELWRKAKTVNRGRAVLACTLAHLIAMKRLVKEGFDIILEDNVRAVRSDGRAKETTASLAAPTEDVAQTRRWLDAAERIHLTIDASRQWEENEQLPSEQQQHQERAERQLPTPQALSPEQPEQAEQTKHSQHCHMRIYGWLGPIANLQWIMDRHSPKRKFKPCDGNGSTKAAYGTNTQVPTIFPYPTIDNLEEDLAEMDLEDAVGDCSLAEVAAPVHTSNDQNDPPSQGQAKSADAADATGDGPASKQPRPGGMPIWGAYCYWISKQGYEALLDTLRSDVGAMLWKSKRQRYYAVKPIDKIMPRTVRSVCGEGSVHVATHPSFFRAPMLTSKIHAQWDPEFCKSTEYQLSKCGGLDWSDLWLTSDEERIVQHRKDAGLWITLSKLRERDQ